MTVNVRIQEFRSNDDYKGWSLESDITHTSSTSITMKATIRDAEGRIRSTGHATEIVGQGGNPKITENCETSAWGRALGNLGIGIDESIASAQEMASYYSTDQAMKKEPTPSIHPTACQHTNIQFKEGINKNGKPYKMNKCADCGNVEWIND